MFGRILIKDLKRRKGINIILLIFMILAVMFVASSVNNILVVSNATKYCLEKGKVPDKYISIYENDEKNTLENWLKKNNSLVKDYSKNKSITISQSNINSFNGKSGEKYSILNTIMLQNQWNKHMLIYDKDKKLLNIKDGQLGMQQGEMDRNNLKAGDKITLKFGELSKEFTITDAIIDPSFGGDFVGMTRYVISDKDFKEIENSGVNINYSYCVDTNNLTSFTKEMNKQGFSIVIAVDKDMFSYSYIMNSIIAAILIVIGICLIIISFLILRFTIAFTIQEEYKEIGIMKAIGIKNFTIKKIYLVKYFTLISVASIIGLILSIPTSNMMLNIVNKNMIMEDGSSNFEINIICSILVMILVMLLCYISTKKLNKFSAIEAIRNGETGERFKKKSKISLNKNKKLNVPLFMAINDIVSNLKRYIVLILTFTIGLLIIIFPVNTISTLKSEEMAKNFSFDTKSDFLIKSDSVQQEFDDLQTKEVIEKNIEKIEDLLKEKGYNAKINTFSIYSIGFYGDDEDDINQIITTQPINSDGSYIEMIDGSIPILENEIAMSEKQMEKFGVNVGDKIYMKLGNETKEMIISGKYQNYMNMGYSAFISNTFPIKDCIMTGCWYYQGDIVDNIDTTNIIKELSEDFPEYDFCNINEAMNEQLGNIGEQLNTVKYTFIALICLINVLITMLMIKIFIMGEKGEIAMLRSIGFTLKSIRKWQVLRISIILLIAVILASILSIFVNDIALRPIFGMMGATHLKIQVNPLEIYFIYPLLLFVVTNLAAYLSTSSINKMNVMEINNIE